MNGLMELLSLATSEQWMADAVCSSVDPDVWFPEKGGTTQPAKRVCAACPVAAECLAVAIDRHERYGVWGGMSERERRKLDPSLAYDDEDTA